MKIALDYDHTYSSNPKLWDKFIDLARMAGEDIRIVTARDWQHDRTPFLRELEGKLPVVYTAGVAKRWYCQHFTDGFVPDIWIDDRPESILENSQATPESLAEWRKERVG
jgi:hypothetical protein